MFRNILVPVDLTEANLAALDVASDLARPCGGSVGLLHVVQTIPGLPLEDERPFYDSLEAAARRRIDEFGRRLERSSTRWSAIVTLGSRVGEILRAVAEREIDLIVLTSHRVHPEDRARGWGTLSYQVAVLAPCAVLLVK